MKDVYQKLVSINVKSEYFGDEAESFVTIQLTSEWNELFKRHHIIGKGTQNGLFVSATPEGRERLKNISIEMPYLTFELNSSFPGIKNFAAVQQYTNRTTPYLVSSEGAEGFDDQYLLPVRRSLGAFYNYPTAVITQVHSNPQEAVDILSETTLRPGDREFPLLLAEFVDGKYTLRGRDFYLAKNGLRPGHCAILALKLSEILVSDEIVRKELQIPTREVYLKYWINSTHHDLNTLSVKDEEGKITFESQGIGAYGVLFQSNTRLKLLQQSPYNIRLVNGKKRPLIDKLPLGNAAEMKPMEQQPDEYFNEVFINV